jgi:threonine dehydrogenase-like Zn-dependent dehydrogenase
MSDMNTTEPQETTEYDHDAVIIGGGPAGCSAGVFTARYGLDTVIFDRGRSSIRRCAHLENYLGFPAGIDIETFYGLMHDHAEEAGCEVVSDMVESVVSADDGDGFRVETQKGEGVSAGCVVAATRYGGEYLRPLDDGGMFETYEHDEETHEHFDRSYADMDGRTVVDGLYVASPSEEADRQAVIAAGRGGRVGLTLVKDVRQERGYPATVADHYDWVRRETELDDEWSGRERWREWFADRVPDDHDLDEERRVALREREIDRRFEQYLSTDEIDQRVERGHDRLLDHIDDERILEHAREIEDGRQSTKISD